jgi:transforming acidic coiled-coil-containing protein 3
MFYLWLTGYTSLFINSANQALEEIQRSKSGEISKLQMMIRKAEMRVSTMERTVEQKSNENKELTEICDDLISKVGT